MSLSADDLTLARGYLSDPGSSAVQSILIDNAVGGTFTISFSGQTTAALAFNAGANDVQNALAALSNIGVGNITVNNTDPYVLYFTGTMANVAQPMVTVNKASLTGVNVTATVTQVALGGVLAFSDTELNLLYTQADQNFALTICYGYRWLMADTSRLNDYVAGQTQEKKSQIFNHLKDMEALWKDWAFADRQVQFTKLQSVPPRTRAYPQVAGVPANSLATRPPNPWGPWPKQGGN